MSNLRFLSRIVGPFGGLVLVIAVFAFLNRDNGRYLTPDNIKAVAIQTAIIGTCGVGMTLVIIGGGIDLSIGSSIALTTVTVALVLNGTFYPTLVETLLFGQRWVAWTLAGILTAAFLGGGRLSGRRAAPLALSVALAWLAGWLVFGSQGGVAAVVAGVLMATGCGLVNGWLVTVTLVVPFIITLGTMEIFRGAAQLLARGESVGVESRLLREQYPWLRRLMAANPEPAWLYFGPGVWLMLGAGVVSAVVLSRMRLGRYIFAIGSNEPAARLSGVLVERTKLLMYGGAGLLTGLAGVMQFSRLSYGSSTAATGLELDVIAAVVIGGGSLRGGEGSIVGTFIGAFLMGFLRNGCDLAGIPNAVQRVITGGIIILAVAMDELRHARR